MSTLEQLPVSDMIKEYYRQNDPPKLTQRVRLVQLRQKSILHFEQERHEWRNTRPGDGWIGRKKAKGSATWKYLGKAPLPPALKEAADRCSKEVCRHLLNINHPAGEGGWH
jgi:hypothetical protein